MHYIKQFVCCFHPPLVFIQIRTYCGGHECLELMFFMSLANPRFPPASDIDLLGIIPESCYICYKPVYIKRALVVNCMIVALTQLIIQFQLSIWA